MQGLAKSAPELNEPIKVEHNHRLEGIDSFDGVPIELARHYEIDVKNMNTEERDKLNDIMKFSRFEGMSMGDILIRLRGIERMLGVNQLKSKYNRVWDYLKISNNIREMEKIRESMIV